MEHNIIFPDEWDDDILARFILQREPFDDYWVRSERRALKVVDTVLRRRPRRRLLDLGCGRGRLIGGFSNLFEEVVAVDANRARIGEARRAAHAVKLKNVEFVDRLFEECVSELGTFDMVLCSHVIQHLPTSVLAVVLEHIDSVLMRGGLLVLLTSHSRAKQDAFKLWRLIGSGSCVTEESLKNAAAFDEVLVKGYLKDRVLSHAFAISSLQNIMRDYRVIKVHCYHALHKCNIVDAILFRDSWINMPWLKGLFGIDVLVIGEKVKRSKCRDVGSEAPKHLHGVL